MLSPIQLQISTNTCATPAGSNSSGESAAGTPALAWCHRSAQDSNAKYADGDDAVIGLPHKHAHRCCTAASRSAKKSLVTPELSQEVIVPTLMRFPDVARVLAEDLQVLAGTGHTGGETPVDLVANLPFVRVLRVGGYSDVFNDHPTVDIDVYAATYTAAELLAEQIRQRLVGPPPPVWSIDRARCDVSPFEAPWPDETVRRFAATYSLTTRRSRVQIP